jgi:hypothetical protein
MRKRHAQRMSVPDHNRQTGSRPTWSKLSLSRQPAARQERLHHLAHTFQRREGEQRVAASRHQTHAHFRVDRQRRLLVAPAEILLGTFERAPALLVGLQPDLAPAPEAVADARRVDEILDAPLPADLTDVLGRDQAGARNMLGASPGAASSRSHPCPRFCRHGWHKVPTVRDAEIRHSLQGTSPESAHERRLQRRRRDAEDRAHAEADHDPDSR